MYSPKLASKNTHIHASDRFSKTWVLEGFHRSPERIWNHVSILCLSENILRHLTVMRTGTCFHQTHAELPFYKCQGGVAHVRNWAKSLSVLCWISLQCITERTCMQYWTLNIYSASLTDKNEEYSFTTLTDNIALHALQARVNCCGAEVQFQKRIIWEFPAVSSCQKAHRMIWDTIIKDSFEMQHAYCM